MLTNNHPGPVDVYITVPSLNFGMTSSEVESAPVLASGGVITGTLTTGMAEVNVPGNGFLTIPKEGNVFEVFGSGSISRINHLNG